MALTLDSLNTLPLDAAARLLDGVYEHSPWVADAALLQRPFVSLAQLQYALAQAVTDAPLDARLALLRAHPELAGKAMEAGSLTQESTHEQKTAGLTACTPQELAHIQALNTAYRDKFGFPFIVAVRGPRGTGLFKPQIIATLERRLAGHPDFELQEALRNVHRIAEIRLTDKFAQAPSRGQHVWDLQESLAAFSDPGFAERGELTVTYLTDAHRACAARIVQDMREAGCDSVHIDAVGNVVGRYEGSRAEARALLTGSHYDTVRNGGKYDGRLGIYVPLACVQALHQAQRRLPFGLEIVAFAEEEGQRYRATFLGAGALTGDFDPGWLEQPDADGVTMRQAMLHVGLDIASIPLIKRDPARYLGFMEVHIEQGPELNARNLPLGIVTSINGSVRYLVKITGTASHAGTSPMNQRQDAVAAFAQWAVEVEQRAKQDGDSVATIGMLNVPQGSVNVVPGACHFSLDMRAPNDAQRDAMAQDLLQRLRDICAERGVQCELEETVRASAAPSDPALQRRWEQAVTQLGLPIHRMPSGAGHDAMKLHQVMPQAMLFVRGENQGISHNPLECTTADDIGLAIQAFQSFMVDMAG